MPREQPEKWQKKKKKKTLRFHPLSCHFAETSLTPLSATFPSPRGPTTSTGVSHLKAPQPPQLHTCPAPARVLSLPLEAAFLQEVKPLSPLTDFSIPASVPIVPWGVHTRATQIPEPGSAPPTRVLTSGGSLLLHTPSFLGFGDIAALGPPLLLPCLCSFLLF